MHGSPYLAASILDFCLRYVELKQLFVYIEVNAAVTPVYDYGTNVHNEL